MSVLDTLTHLLEGAYPEKGSAQNKKDAQALFAANKDRIQSVLGSLISQPPVHMAGGGSVEDQLLNLNIPSANMVPSSFDVTGSNVSTTANGGGVSPEMTDYDRMKAGMPLNIPAPTVPAFGDQTPAPAISIPPTQATVPSPTDSTVSAPPAATPAAAPVKPASPNAPTGDNSLASALTTPTSSDNEKRQEMLSKLEQQKKLGLIPNALGGIADALGNAAKPFGGQGSSGNQDAVIAAEKESEASQKGEFETKLKNDPNSDTSRAYRQMVLQIAPELAKNPDFLKMSAQSIGDKLPLIDTMMKAKAAEDSKKVGLAQAASNRELSMGLRQDQQQDKLEQNARQMVSNLRGDKSLARAEEQRDAAIVAYNRLDEIEKSGKGLNPIDYTDILGQIYKARTGATPGEQVLQEIRQATAKGSLGKAYTYVTGQQAPATTQDIAASLKNMAQSMGSQADKFHDGYMKAHLIKPSGLEDSRWQPILQTGRGISFAEATKQNAPIQGGTDIESKRAALRQKLGI